MKRSFVFGLLRQNQHATINVEREFTMLNTKLEVQLEQVLTKMFLDDATKIAQQKEKKGQKEPTYQKINNVLHVSRDDSYSRVVSRGIYLDKLIKKLTSELKTISGHLKLYGKSKIDKFNKDNFDSVKSIRIPSTDESTVLVSIKSVLRIDKEAVANCKPHVDPKTFESLFEEKTAYSLKEEFAEKIIVMLRKVLGDEIIDNSFNKTTSLTLKDREAFANFIKDESVDEKLREKLADAVKLNEISITY